MDPMVWPRLFRSIQKTEQHELHNNNNNNSYSSSLLRFAFSILHSMYSQNYYCHPSGEGSQNPVVCDQKFNILNENGLQITENLAYSSKVFVKRWEMIYWF